MTTKAHEYVLGTDTDELVRLGFQARLWSDDAVSLWKRAGFRPGQTILDVGCGPGFASRDLAQLLGPTGRVVGIDESARFLEHLAGAELTPHSAPIETRLADVQRMELEAGRYDGAYARWVLCFVKDPGAVVANVARALRPGAAAAFSSARSAGRASPCFA
jgi:ubiquinone/menaquinone biosynthesis C-methylase UbiE